MRAGTQPTVPVDEGCTRLPATKRTEGRNITPWNVDRIVSYLVVAAAADEAIWEL
jgi:hypothetical protein